jgi:hypothetical protein
VWGVKIGESLGSTPDGGFRYDHPVKQIEDYDQIQVPTFTFNPEATERNYERWSDLLGDAMEVRPTCGPPLHPNLSPFLEQVRGMADMNLDMALHPQVVHQTMARFMRGVLAAMAAAEATGLLTPNNEGPMACSDPVGPEPVDGKLRLRNLWTGANSQEFDTVSPAMFDEFLMTYLHPICHQFGAVQFGCCENLTTKADLVMQIPNLRIFVSSYWTDLDTVIEKTAGRVTIMWRQPASLVTLSDDLEPIRRHLDGGLCKLQGYPYQVVLRELETLHGHPERLRDWARVAIELAEKYA